MRLTDLLIKGLKPPTSGQKTHFDETLRGFGIRVSQGGTKSFVALIGTTRKRRTIGRYPDISLADARREAKRLLANASIEELVRRPSVPFADAKERFLSDTEARTKSRTVTEYRRLLDRHFQYSKPLQEITRQDVMRVVEKARSAPSEAKHAFVAIRTMMNWCVKHGLIDVSPVPRIAFKAEARSRILSDAELMLVWERAVEVGYPYGDIMRLLILTGQRRGEIAGLRRSWIEGSSITFPVGFTKNKREHHLPIGAMTKQILDRLPDVGDLLFPARGSDERAMNGWSKCKRSFDHPLQIAPYTLHDLRRTFSSNMARIGTPIHVTERLLNHVSGTVSGVAAVYNRYSYAEEMRVAMDVYEAQIDTLLSETSMID
jgi:integrase